MNAYIRPLQPADRPAVQRLFEETWNFRKFLSDADAGAFAASMAADILCSSDYHRGVFTGSQLAALIAGSSADGQSQANTLEILIVHPRFQRLGLGSRLLSGFEDWCSAANRLPLQTVSDSECQWKFYEKNGFSLTEEKKMEVSGRDVVFYYFEKPLKPASQFDAEIPVMTFTSRLSA